MEHLKKAIWTVTITISLLVIAWFGMSYIEVISKNNNENPQYNKYNVFELIVEHNEGK